MSELPRLYAGLYASFRADLPFWRRLASAAGSPVLELGSGTGRVAAHLARQGLAVTGIDSDPDMIAWAEQHRPPLLPASLAYRLSDMTRFRLPDRFRIALCPCNTLSLLPLSQARRSLRCARRHLLPGGIFAAELPLPRDLRAQDLDPSQPLAAFREPQTQRPVQVYARQRWDAGRRSANIEWLLDELLPDGGVVRHSYWQRLHLWEPGEIQDAVREAGFAGSSLLGGYEGEKYDEHSRRMLVVAIAP